MSLELLPEKSSEGELQQANDEENHHHHVIDVGISAAAHDHHIRPQSPLAHRDIAGGSTVIMKYLVFALLGLVSIIYDGRADVLLSKYRVQFWCLAAALCIYWTTMKAQVHLNTSKFNLNTLNCIALACEVLAVISLVSILVPHDISFLVFCATVYSTAVSAVVILTYIYWFGKQECLSAPLQTIVQVHDDV